jgi:hypothetical protein
MKIHTVVTQANGIISLVIQPSFVGDMTDGNDKALIAAFGDPQVNIAGSYTDTGGSPPPFFFQFPTSEMYVGITTQLSSQVAQFTLALPSGPPNQPAPIQGPMMCITPNPSLAAQVWQTTVVSRITQAFASLRNQTLVPSIPNVTV